VHIAFNTLLGALVKQTMFFGFIKPSWTTS